jgi:broad specificity polyphosphatase/5'/3'-nucleotidase SurE
VTNDDGIDAPGLHALRQIAEEVARPSDDPMFSYVCTAP